MRNHALIATSALLLAACASVSVPESRPAQGAATKPGETRPVPATPPAPAPATTPKKGGGYYKDDGPGDNPPPDMASIPDAEPKAEPLHRFANRPYAALGQNYVPRVEISPYRESGIASWYGRRFHGVRTSSGERYDMYGMTAAHPTLPIPSYVRVTNVDNGKSVVVRVNDRGPFHANRVIDLSYTAAWKLGYVSKGSTRVEVEAIVPEGVAMLGKKIAPAGAPQATADIPPPPSTETPLATPALPPPVVREVAAASAAVPATPVPAVSTASNTSNNAAMSAEAPVTPAGIYLQLGAFTSSRNAEDFRDYAQQELGSIKQQLVVVADMDRGRERFRLHLGPFTTASVAREMADRVAGKLKLKPFVVQR